MSDVLKNFAIRALELAENATKGPYRVEQRSKYWAIQHYYVNPASEKTPYLLAFGKTAVATFDRSDAEFFAASIDLVPGLAESLLKYIDGMERCFKTLDDQCCCTEGSGIQCVFCDTRVAVEEILE